MRVGECAHTERHVEGIPPGQLSDLLAHPKIGGNFIYGLIHTPAMHMCDHQRVGWQTELWLQWAHGSQCAVDVKADGLCRMQMSQAGSRSSSTLVAADQQAHLCCTPQLPDLLSRLCHNCRASSNLAQIVDSTGELSYRKASRDLVSSSPAAGSLWLAAPAITRRLLFRGGGKWGRIVKSPNAEGIGGVSEAPPRQSLHPMPGSLSMIRGLRCEAHIDVQQLPTAVGSHFIMVKPTLLEARQFPQYCFRQRHQPSRRDGALQSMANSTFCQRPRC